MNKEFLIKRGTCLKYIKETKYFFNYGDIIDVYYDTDDYLVDKIFFKNGEYRISLVNVRNKTIFDAFVNDIGSKLLNESISQGKYYITLCKYNTTLKDTYDCLIIERNIRLESTFISPNTKLFFDFDTESFPILNKFFNSEIPFEHYKILLELDERKKVIKEKDNKETLNKNDNNVDLFFNIEGKQLDEDQIESCKYVGNHLVIAGAGAGKTLSIVGKIKYLIKKEKVNPSEILVLSFTDKVVTELRERIGKAVNDKIDILTFHKLGLKVFKTVKDYREIDLTSIYKYTKKIMYSDYLKNDLELASMMKHFANGKYDSRELISDEEVDALLKNVNKCTIKGEKVNSVSALIVCNLLYKNNINYAYTSNNSYFHYLEIDNKYTIYFTLDSDNIDTLGLKNVMYNQTPSAVYNFLESKGYKITERLPYNAFLNNPFEAKKYEELFESILEAYNITSACDAYDEDFDFLIEHFCNGKQQCILFIEIFKRIKKLIIKLLEELHQTDFSYMISGPASILKRNKCMPYKYIIVDEFQDIAPARYNLLIELLKQNDGYLMAYGDDWQSIFSFAGSNNRFFMEFSKKLPNAKEFYLKNTYRNSIELIKASSDFIAKNPIQKNKSITSKKSLTNPIILLNYQTSNMDSLLFTLNKINKEKKTKKVKLMILGRTNFSIDAIKDRPEFIHIGEDENESPIYHFIGYEDIDIIFLTIHRSKGLEADYVFVTSVHSKMMPLDVKKDRAYLNIINKLNEYEEEKEHEKYEGLPNSEERRLFYVALTRSKNNVFLSIPANHPYIKASIFIKDLLYESKSYIQTFEVNKLYEIPAKDKCPICGGLVSEVSKKGKIYRFCENKCKI